MRLDAAGVLKRFHYLERSVVLSCAGWITPLHSIEAKALLARIGWQSALTAEALRERVFELRFPNRLIEVGDDQPLVRLFEAGTHAPSAAAMIDALAGVYLPALIDAQEAYLAASDELADGPSRRFLALSIREKREQIEELRAAAANEREARGAVADDLAAQEMRWLDNVGDLLERLGGVGLMTPPRVEVPVVVAPGHEFAVPSEPGRDQRYFRCSFYWPDAIDPSYGYGSGAQLQLRVAVSHLNEVWAVEVAGAALFELAEELGWEFVLDAARWTYDESRHMLMGQRRISAWGLESADVPLGRYIFDAASDGHDPVYRIGMLGYFETKNIGRKRERARALGALGDAQSERDMEFDWADETIHAEYGRRWLKRLLEVRGRPATDYADVLAECESLVAARTAAATPEETAAISECADRLTAAAARLAAVTT